MSVKKAGHCTYCDKAVFEIKERHTEGILEGFPKKMGKALDIAYKVEYYLSDGTRCTMTCCRDCLDAMVDPKNYQQIWDKVLRSFIFENRNDVREKMGSRIPSEKQKEALDKFILDQTNNYIIYAAETASWTT